MKILGLGFFLSLVENFRFGCKFYVPVNFRLGRKGGGDLAHLKTHFNDPKYLECAKLDQYSSFSR